MSPRSHPAYQLINFGVIALIVLTFSVALTPALGLVGFLIPPVLIGTAYIFVSVALDGLIYLVERLTALGGWQAVRRHDRDDSR